MKIPFPALALCFVAGSFAGAALAVDLPVRKAGLWEIQSKSEGASVTMQQCIDADSDKILRDAGQSMAAQMGKDTCTQNIDKKLGGGIVIDSVCKLGTTTVTAHSEFSGDFNSAYRMDRKAVYNPPMMGKAESVTSMEGKWLGACKGDQRPGDTIMPGGQKMNMLDQLKRMKK